LPGLGCSFGCGLGGAATTLGFAAAFTGFDFGAGFAAALRDGAGDLVFGPFGAGFAAADLETDLAAGCLAGESLEGRRERSDRVDFTMTGSAFLSGHKACAPPTGNPALRGASMDQAEPGDPDHDQVDRDDVVEELRHDEDQDSGDKRDDRLNVGNREHQGILLQGFGVSNGMGVTPYPKSLCAPCSIPDRRPITGECRPGSKSAMI
jgi:hypothetical protein